MNSKLLKCKQFIKNHPILTNFVLIILTGFLLVWVSLLWVDSWTGHGEYRVVPDVKTLPYDRAAEILEETDLFAELSDSIFSDTGTPGAVLEQIPKEGSTVKPNRKVYLTITAYSPKSVTIPKLDDTSLRHAQSVLEGLGITNIKIKKVPSEYKDLVLSAKFNGVPLGAGARVPVSATITLEVGEGISIPEIDNTVIEEAPVDDFDML